jgi:REP element-mobilizing transposase RayT
MRAQGRASMRLRGFDYRSEGAYFITICTRNRECLLGSVVSDNIVLSAIGDVVAAAWNAIPRHFPTVDLDAYIVMPNHVHGILSITAPRRGTACRAPTERFGRPVPGSIPSGVRSFKSAATREANREKGSSGASLWQRGYYEHVVRSDEELNRLRRYVQENPLRWSLEERIRARVRRGEASASGGCFARDSGLASHPRCGLRNCPV